MAKPPSPTDFFHFVNAGEVEQPAVKPPQKGKGGKGLFSNYSRSEKYQWLPAEIRLAPNGKVQWQSYINNLNPKEHGALYGALAEIFREFTPLFEKCLTDLHNQSELRPRVDIPDELYSSGPDDDDERDEWEENKVPKVPTTVPTFSPPEKITQVTLRDSTLQVIVKIAEIILTPENPTYPGGSWHVEGMQNEQIVASGIYYFESTNITESRLNFRRAIGEPDYEQGDDKGVAAIYNLHDEEPLNQSLGSLVTQTGRCIAFPNLFQHQVQSFELEDKTKPGIRKLLVYFLVSPKSPVMSTRSVPPQQHSWIAHELRKISFFRDMPDFILQKILYYAEMGLSHAEAVAHQSELMDERKYFVKTNTERVFERPFSLCEH